MIGSRGNLREKLVSITYDSQVGGNAGVQNSYKRLKAMFF